jgi:hypothetical protein
MGRSARHLGTAMTLAGLVLLAGCSMPFGSLPASEPNAMDPKTMSDSERGLFAGLLLGKETDLPPPVPVPMREATIERGFGGVMVRATGVAPTQGYFNQVLVADDEGRPDAAGVITLRLLAVPPLAPEAIGPERTRLLMTAAFFQELELRGIKAIRVVSALDVATLPVPPRPAQPAPPPEDLAEL